MSQVFNFLHQILAMNIGELVDSQVCSSNGRSCCLLCSRITRTTVVRSSILFSSTTKNWLVRHEGLMQFGSSNFFAIMSMVGINLQQVNTVHSFSMFMNIMFIGQKCSVEFFLFVHRRTPHHRVETLLHLQAGCWLFKDVYHPWNVSQDGMSVCHWNLQKSSYASCLIYEETAAKLSKKTNVSSRLWLCFYAERRDLQMQLKGSLVASCPKNGELNQQFCKTI